MKIEKGFVLSPRIFYESELSKKPPHFRELWFWLIQKANHKDRRTRGNLLKRGELITSYAEIIDSLKWYVGGRKETYKSHQIESALKYLLKTNAITKAKTKKVLLITICNYGIYQNPNNYESQNESQYETGSKPDRKPIYKQELKNVTRIEEVCVNTHPNFSLTEIENLFQERGEVLKLELNKDAPEKFFDHYNTLSWTFAGKPMNELAKFVDKWIRKDAREKLKSIEEKKPGKMVVKMPEKYSTGWE